MIEKKIEKKFKVKQWILEEGKDKNKGMLVRKVVDIAKDLSWTDAKKKQRENKGSWIV